MPIARVSGTGPKRHETVGPGSDRDAERRQLSELTRGNPTRYVNAARALRDFGDGFVAVLLPVYLTSMGLGPFQVGIVAGTALFGSTLTTLAIGMLGAKKNLRNVLVAASCLMIVTGLVFAGSANYWVVLLIAFVGTVNPSPGSASIFVPLEQALISHVVSDQARTHAFVRYSLIGAFAAAVGSLAAGGIDLLAAFGISHVVALRAMFVLYALLGVGGALLYGRISVAHLPASDAGAVRLGQSRGIVYKIAVLFAVDSFAGGFAVQAIMALWLFGKFGLSLTAAGLFFFWSGVLSAASLPAAGWLSRRIGLVNTMTFTHIPSSIALILAAVSPRLDVAIALLLVRGALSQMDVPTRISYLMAVVTPAERPAAASITSVTRGFSAAGPAIAGAFLAAGLPALPLVICGVLKIVYDVSLLFSFRHIKPPEERREIAE